VTAHPGAYQSARSVGRAASDCFGFDVRSRGHRWQLSNTTVTAQPKADGFMSKPQTSTTPSRMLEKIGAARAGDEQALEDVIRHYQGRVAGYVVSLVGRDTADFDDLCQVVFVKMALSLPKFRSLDLFEPWLFKIARNVCRDHLRRLRLCRLFVSLSHDHEAIAAEQAKDPEARLRALDGAMKTLSGVQRELIDLLRGREYSYEELARITKSSVRSVAGRLFRARASLRKFFSYNGGGR
jgi:RNA polymerase sigma-70 factor, ECF subfamily